MESARKYLLRWTEMEFVKFTMEMLYLREYVKYMFHVQYKLDINK